MTWRITVTILQCQGRTRKGHCEKSISRQMLKSQESWKENPVKSPGSNHTAPKSPCPGDWKHCALSTQPNPHLKMSLLRRRNVFSHVLPCRIHANPSHLKITVCQKHQTKKTLNKFAWQCLEYSIGWPWQVAPQQIEILSKRKSFSFLLFFFFF